ncbi:MAG TPA: L-seryl-tRNA(Sec) selenium transferase [Jatrophihabitans sp.]|nr:L-seryl-tRNA(Sec) selenium transferase [Jatrophihabitans sp.]
MTELDQRRLVPRTDVLLADPALAEPIERLGAELVKATVGLVQQRIRAGELAPDRALAAVLESLPADAGSLRPVLNATGVVLHTNLGRAPLSQAARQAIAAAAGYVDVEFDRLTGRRARRGRGCLAALAAAVPEAEDVLVLNNGAAALVLAVSALAAGREVVLSRGELVEIGDGFRLPELVESTGARIREVGTTNRTTVADYRAAIGDRTGCVLKVHPSNFRLEGFTGSVGVGELAQLLAGSGVPLVVDVGSGQLRPDPALPDEPDVASALVAGAQLVTCSGDKLLGGPQAGLAFGAADQLAAMRQHPLARALRVDKLTLAGLEASLRGPATPTSRYLHADPELLRGRCADLLAALAGEPDLVQNAELTAELAECAVVPSEGAVGGGGAPGVPLPGWALSLPARFAEPLRTGDPAVIGRIERGRCLLDLRCIEPSDDPAVLAAIRAVRG